MGNLYELKEEFLSNIKESKVKNTRIKTQIDNTDKEIDPMNYKLYECV